MSEPPPFLTRFNVNWLHVYFEGLNSSCKVALYNLQFTLEDCIVHRAKAKVQISSNVDKRHLCELDLHSLRRLLGNIASFNEGESPGEDDDATNIKIHAEQSVATSQV